MAESPSLADKVARSTAQFTIECQQIASIDTGTLVNGGTSAGFAVPGDLGTSTSDLRAVCLSTADQQGGSAHSDIRCVS